MDPHIPATEARRITEEETTPPRSQSGTTLHRGGLPDLAPEISGGPARGFMPTLVAIEIVLDGISQLMNNPQVRDRITFSRASEPPVDYRPQFRNQCGAAIEILTQAATTTTDPSVDGFNARILALSTLHRMEIFAEMAFPRESDLYSAANYLGDADMRLLVLDLKNDLLITQVKIHGMHHGLTIGG